MKHITSKLLSLLLCLAMLMSMVPVAYAVEETGGATALTSYVTVNGGATQHATLEEAIAAAEPVDGVITYTISGKVEVTATGWVRVAKADLTSLKEVKFIGTTEDAEICITNSTSVLADQVYDIDVSFEELTLSHPNGKWVQDLGHATNYFACVLRNTDAANNTVTYTNCVFPNGVCNNQYGKTVFDKCSFTNTTTGLYNLWNYGGNTEIRDSSFTGVRGIKTYNEGTLAVAPTVTVENTTFTNLREKAAIVASKATDITLDSVSATDCDKGLFQKAIEGSNDTEEVVILPSGSNVSGTFNVNGEKGVSEADKENFNITAGTFTSAVEQDYLASGATYDAKTGTVTSGTSTTYVAKVGETSYDTLEGAIANAVNGDNVTLLVDTKEDVTINKNITLDLGGKTLTNTGAGKATISVTGGTVTVKNGAVTGGASYYNIEVTKGSNANLTLEGVTATAGNTGSSMIDNWGTMTISSGEYSGGLNVVKSEEDSKLTINGGTFSRDTAPKYDITGVILVYGDTTIIGGEFHNNANTTGSRTIVTGVVEGYASITKVTGGNFTSKGGAIFHGLGKATSDNFEVSGGTFNKSISDGYCADGFIPTKNADGTYGVKEGKYVVKVGSTGYETFDGAIDAANKSSNSKTIKLLEDLTVDHRIVIKNVRGKAITLDLGGYTLTNSYGGGGYSLLTHTAVTMKNGTYKSTNISARGIGAVADFTLEDAKLSAAGLVGLGCSAPDATYTVKNSTVIGNYALANFVNNAKIKIEDSSTITGSGVGIYHNGSNSGLQLTATGSTITAAATGATNGIYVSGSTSTMTAAGAQQVSLTNCTVSGGTAVEVKYTDLTLTDCTVTATAETPSYTQDDNGAATTGFAVVSTDNTTGAATPAPKGTITIQGANGSYKGQVGLASLETVKTEYADFKDTTYAVSGGSFTKAVLPEYCATGYIPQDNGDGTYGVKVDPSVAEVNGKKYESLAEAIAAAPRKATVKLLRDTKENVTIDKMMTLDLNGYTLNGGTVKGTPTLKIDNARVTVMDSSEAQTGTIMREDTAENSGVSSHYVIDVQGKHGFLKFEGGNVRNNSGNADGSKGASLVRVGDDKNKVLPTMTIIDGTFTQNNFIVLKVDYGTLYVKGGTVSSKTSYAVENWRYADIKENAVVNGAVSSWTYSGGSNSTLTISGGKINGNVESVSYDGAEGKLAKVAITGGTVNGTLIAGINNESTTDPAKATIEITGGTFSKDPTKYLVEGSTVTTNGDGTFGVEKAYLAQVGENSYYTMDEAFKAQTTSREPIVLLRNYTTGSTFSSGSVARVVDLNGHTWTCTGTDANSAAFEINYADASLTVKNGKIVSSQLVGLIPSASGGTITYDNSILTFEGVEMSTTATSGIETNGNNTNDTVTLKNSTLNVPNGFGIYFPSSGKLTIENSTINAKTMGVQVCAGSLNINGGSKITVTGDAVPKGEGDGAIQDGAAISIVNRTGYKGLGKIEVTGGTFTAKTGNAAIKAYDWADKNESDFTANNNVAVSGGTFSSAVPEDLCAPNYEPVANDNGTYGVAHFNVARIDNVYYESLQDAFNAVTVDSQQTIVLLHDVTVTKTLTFKKDYSDTPTILKMQGHSITGKGCRALQIVNGHLKIEGRDITDEASIITSTGIAINSSVIRVGAADVAANSKQNLSLALGVTVTTDCSYGIAVFGAGVETLGVENSKVISKADTNASYDGCAISTLGTDTTAANVTIKTGAHIEAKNTNAIYMPSGNLLVFGYPTITGLTGIYAKAGRVTIKGAKVYGTGEAKDYSYNGNGGVPTGDALVLDSCGYPAGTLKVDFGDTDAPYFDSANAKPIGSYEHGSGTRVTGFVDKGTFNKSIDADLLADDYICKYDAVNKLYGVDTVASCDAKIGNVYYESLADAIAAAQDGDTVTLVNDVNTPETTYVINKSITIDLNSKTVTGGGYDGVFQIDGENAKAVIKNGSIVAVEQRGSEGKYTMAIWACATGCEVTLENLDVSQKITHTDDKQMDMIYTSKGTIIINSGTFESGTPAWTLNCKDAAYKDGTANIIVNGGTFVGYDPRNAENEGKGTSFVAKGVGVSSENGSFTAKSGMAAQIVDADGGSVKAYGTLSEALAAVTADQTIKLLDDVDVSSYVVVNQGTVDLNGYALTANLLFTMPDGAVIDSKQGEGKINAVVRFENPTNAGYLPVKDNDGNYRLFEYMLKKDEAYRAENGLTYFYFKLNFTSTNAWNYLQSGKDHGVEAMIRLTWDEQTNPMLFEFDNAYPTESRDENYWYLYLSVSSFGDKLSGKTVEAQMTFGSLGVKTTSDKLGYVVPEAE